jgi:hypothetical protein
MISCSEKAMNKDEKESDYGDNHDGIICGHLIGVR